VCVCVWVHSCVRACACVCVCVCVFYLVQYSAGGSRLPLLSEEAVAPTGNKSTMVVLMVTAYTTYTHTDQPYPTHTHTHTNTHRPTLPSTHTHTHTHTHTGPPPPLHRAPDSSPTARGWCRCVT